MATIIFTQDNTGVSTTLTNTKVMPGKIVGVESTPTTSVNTLKLSGGDGEKVISTSVEPRKPNVIISGRELWHLPSKINWKTIQQHGLINCVDN